MMRIKSYHALRKSCAEPAGWKAREHKAVTEAGMKGQHTQPSSCTEALGLESDEQEAATKTAKHC
jgi:hypothetical protein